MASGSNSTGDADYDSSLKQLMQTCLPPVLAEIVDRRPADPITYLAQALYKFREAEEAVNLSKTMSGASGSTDRLPYSHTAHRACNTTQSSGNTSNRSSGHAVSQSDSTAYRSENQPDTIFSYNEEESKNLKTMSGASGSTDRLPYSHTAHRAGNTTHPSGNSSHHSSGHAVSDSPTYRSGNHHQDSTVRVVPRLSTNMPPAAVRLIHEDLGDEGLGEIREELGDITSNMVHTSEEIGLKCIGDIFDDSDIT